MLNLKPCPYLTFVLIFVSHSQKLKAKLFLIFFKKTRKTPSRKCKTHILGMHLAPWALMNVKHNMNHESNIHKPQGNHLAKA